MLSTHIVVPDAASSVISHLSVTGTISRNLIGAQNASLRLMP